MFATGNTPSLHDPAIFTLILRRFSQQGTPGVPIAPPSHPRYGDEEHEPFKRVRLGLFLALHGISKAYFIIE